MEIADKHYKVFNIVKLMKEEMEIIRKEKSIE